MKFDVLPDLVLLEIFDFYLGKEGQKEELDKERLHAWCTLVHVCRRWRDLVFGSPRGLGLQFFYDAEVPLEIEKLDVWPPLPIAICAGMRDDSGVHDVNIVPVLEHNHRIGRIDVRRFPKSKLETVLAAMHQPFPALIFLQLWPVNEDELVLVIPDSFLGGSAPHLRTLILDHIPFPGLPNLLLSATHLVEICFHRIPHAVYLPPEMMVDCLSVLSRLKVLKFDFESPRSRVDQNSRHPPPPTRVLLPVLSEFCYRGLNSYLEGLVAPIDAPLLDKLEIVLSHEPIMDTPELTQFINRAPNIKAHDKAQVRFLHREASVSFQWARNKWLELGISYEESDLQLSSLAQLCTSSFPQGIIPAVGHLSINWYDPLGSLDLEYAGNSQWLELLRPFTGARVLYICDKTVPRITPALQELVGERVTEVLPGLVRLEIMFLTPGRVHEGVAEFVSARQLSGNPIALSCRLVTLPW